MAWREEASKRLIANGTVKNQRTTGDSDMIHSIKLAALALAATALTGCVASSGGTTQTGSASSGTPSMAEQGCLRDVTKTTNNPDVVLLDSTFSEAGTEVIVGVGEQRARWRCIGYRDGITGGIISLTDEGRL